MKAVSYTAAGISIFEAKIAADADVNTSPLVIDEASTINPKDSSYVNVWDGRGGSRQLFGRGGAPYFFQGKDMREMARHLARSLRAKFIDPDKGETVEGYFAQHESTIRDREHEYRCFLSRALSSNGTENSLKRPRWAFRHSGTALAPAIQLLDR